MKQGNLFKEVVGDLPGELIETLASGQGKFRIERIVSRDHSSPDDFWYEQESTEWVALLAGSAVLKFEEAGEKSLSPGDWIEIPPRVRHRVESTSTAEDTIWLALHWE
jgi:cupin 2 domain-containing protein